MLPSSSEVAEITGMHYHAYHKFILILLMSLVNSQLDLLNLFNYQIIVQCFCLKNF
jgi:hypothetical protein